MVSADEHAARLGWHRGRGGAISGIPGYESPAYWYDVHGVNQGPCIDDAFANLRAVRFTADGTPSIDAYAYYLERLGLTLFEIRAISERLGVDAQWLLMFVAQQRGISEAEVNAQFSMDDDWVKPVKASRL